VEIARKGAELEARSRRGPIMDTYGWALVKNQQYEEAVKVMLKADSLYGDPDAEVEYHLGEAYLGVGEVDKALDCLVQSLAMKEDKEVLDEFNKVYARKYGSAKGAQTYLNKAILVAAAVDEPYPAPDFTLMTLKDEEMKLSDHLGKVILVNFWKPG
jgi:tetratricopeptide (TPR) repeat protein